MGTTSKGLLGNADSWIGYNDDASSGANVYVNLGNFTFKVTLEGTKLTFKYAGMQALSDDNTAFSDSNVFTQKQADELNEILRAGVQVEIVGDVEAFQTAGNPDHWTLDVQWAEADDPGKKAGMDLDISSLWDDDIIGTVLTIDDEEYAFIDADGMTPDEIDGNLISIWSADSKDDQIRKAVDQLSQKAGGENFDIQAKDAKTIHIDQKVDSDEIYGAYQKLARVFSARTGDTSDAGKLIITAAEIKSGDSIIIGDTSYTFVENSTGADGEIFLGRNNADAIDNLIEALKNENYTVNQDGDTLTITASTGSDLATPFVIGGGLTLQIGDTADLYNKMTVTVNDMSTKGLGISGQDITTESSASSAIDIIKDAINKVSTQRAALGVLQNRLDHTINNLAVAVENLSAANSRIRDINMAKEMMTYTQMNVLIQSAQAMLAQANQQPQSVLQLLQ